jgi:hypothetical protein
MAEIHTMDVTLEHDRQIVRYSCPVCGRCFEDGPDRLTLIERGDASAIHRAGSLSTLEAEAEPASPTPPLTH